jgi:radial spoke head protein 9
MALMKLQVTSKAEELHLWGKVTGLYADYYIAVSYAFSGMYEFPVKKFFWALSKGELEFQEMPELNDQHKVAVNSGNHAYFEGNPKKKLVSVTKSGEEGAEGEAAPEKEAADEEGGEGGAAKGKDNLSDLSEEEEIRVIPKDLSELDRLAYVVFAIENDCTLAPSGAYKMTPTHQVRRNEAFRGLSVGGAESMQLRSYLHFRNVQTQEYKDQLDQPGAPFNAGFLEPIEHDFPRGQWTIQVAD